MHRMDHVNSREHLGLLEVLLVVLNICQARDPRGLRQQSHDCRPTQILDIEERGAPHQPQGVYQRNAKGSERYLLYHWSLQTDM